MMQDSSQGEENFKNEDYKLCSNYRLKIVSTFGVFLILASLCLGIAMMSLPSWITINVVYNPIKTNKYSLNRAYGIMQECYSNLRPDYLNPKTPGQCYFKNFGQYLDVVTPLIQMRMATAEVTTLGLAIIFNALALAMSLHMSILWCRSSYDSQFFRKFRHVIGVISSLSSILYLATIVLYHLDLFEEVKHIPYASRPTVTLSTGPGYPIAWVGQLTSTLSAWLFISSTYFWSMDYYNCGSVMSEFHPPCNHKMCVVERNFVIPPSAYSMDSLSKWSLHDVPTLPRFQTSTYGDGKDLCKTDAPLKYP